MKRGDVVEIDWQFSDLTGSKVRPAVVVPVYCDMAPPSNNGAVVLRKVRVVIGTPMPPETAPLAGPRWRSD